MHPIVSPLERIALLRKDLGRPMAMDWEHRDVEIVVPAIDVWYEPSVHLDGQIEKISAAAFGTVQAAVSTLPGHRRTCKPIRARRLRNCYITHKRLIRPPATVVTLNLRRPDAPHPWRYATVDEPVALCSSVLGTHFFGDWLRDDCPTRLLAQDRGRIRRLETPNWPDADVYRRIFGHDDLTAENHFYRDLTLFDDAGQNPHKAERFRQLRRRVLDACPASNPEIVYMRRGATGAQRELHNEDELIALLEGLGTTIIEPETDGDALIRKCLGAKIFVSIEGSQLSHALYTLRDRAGLLVIQPPDRFYVSHRDWSAVMGIPFGFIVGDAEAGGFRVNLDDFQRTLDRLAARLDAPAEA
ncbi:glycosyltransferase 61 family protein [Albimonas pacifica]|uniref:Glycosyltransferase 61 catalytic domain-containing protein n=1 Tax=Albimonas pacifica TaxID=1114924 RepID=A0A1I3K1L0_9RHOB|nr:glycosyltransferase family 61 protein [Albimonas pacifica]SFI66065.1 Protein of unknown function [Albimonas pacifica]